MRRLYDIAEDFAALEAMLLETGGEWTPEVEQAFAALGGELATRVDGYAALIREWELDAEKWKAEEERVAAHRKARENAARRLKTRLCEHLVAMGQEKVAGVRFSVAVQRAAPSVEVLVAPEELPVEFQRTIPAKVEADKKALLDAAKAAGGELVRQDGEEGDFVIVTPLARLVPGTPFVRIR
jgi:hypothetical protein